MTKDGAGAVSAGYRCRSPTGAWLPVLYHGATSSLSLRHVASVTDPVVGACRCRLSSPDDTAPRSTRTGSPAHGQGCGLLETHVVFQRSKLAYIHDPRRGLGGFSHCFVGFTSIANHRENNTQDSSKPRLPVINPKRIGFLYCKGKHRKSLMSGQLTMCRAYVAEVDWRHVS